MPDVTVDVPDSAPGKRFSQWCVTSPLPAHAANKSASAALMFESQTITWSVLEVKTRRLAAWIYTRVSQASGDEKQIAIWLPNSPALVLFFIAGVRAGFEVQVFDSEWPQSLVDRLVDELSPALLVDTKLVQDPFADCCEFEDSIDLNKSSIPLDTATPNTLFYAGFTSGSSGTPKGFRRDHASWIASFSNDQIECPLEAGDVIVAPGALSHSLFMYALMRGLHAGVPVVFCRRFSARNVAREIARHRGTVLYSVPAHIGMLIRQGADYFQCVRRVFSSGAKWPENWLAKFNRAFPNAELCEFYGASELSFISIARSSEAIPDNSVGRAFHGVDISIRTESGDVLPAGEIGIVFAASDMLFSGYAGAGERSIGKQGRSMTVGDLGYLDENGYLYLVGRRDRMIVSSGKNIYPEEVEAVLLRHRCVESAAVLALNDEKRGQRLVAFLRCAGDQPPDRSGLIAHCAESLPRYKVPTKYAVCNPWPTTRSGKTDYKALEINLQRDDCLFLK